VHQQALVGEPADQVGHQAPVVRGDGRRTVEVEPAGEHAEPAEQRALRVVEQVVAPVDHVAQRAVPVVGAAPAGQQLQVVGEAGEQAVHTERGDPGRGQLDGQRHPVQPGTQPADLGALVGEVRVGGLGPVQEQCLGLRAQRAAGVRRDQGQRRHPDGALAGHSEPFPAGGQHGQLRTPGQQPLGQRRGRVQQVLAVVQHQ
jgi:hypothetical protein